jgi:hypothetical protein
VTKSFTRLSPDLCLLGDFTFLYLKTLLGLLQKSKFLGKGVKQKRHQSFRDEFLGKEQKNVVVFVFTAVFPIEFVIDFSAKC